VTEVGYSPLSSDEVKYIKYRKMCQTQQHFVTFFIVLGQHVSIRIESSSGPSKTIDPCLEIVLEGPEDDSIRIEICCRNTITNIIKFCCV
jgi:hypothetical protein